MTNCSFYAILKMVLELEGIYVCENNDINQVLAVHTVMFPISAQALISAHP